MSAGMTLLAQLVASGSVGAFLLAVVQALATRRKRGVDDGRALAEAAFGMLAPTKEVNDYLRRELTTALAELSALRAQIVQLTSELDAARHELAALRGTIHPGAAGA